MIRLFPILLSFIVLIPIATAEIDYSKTVDLDDYTLRREIPINVVDKRGREKDAVLVNFRIKQCIYPDGVQVCGRAMSIDSSDRQFEMGWWGLYGVRKPGERGRAKWLIEPKYLVWRQLTPRYALVREPNQEFCRLDLQTQTCDHIGGTRLIETIGEWPDWVSYITYTFDYDVRKMGSREGMTPFDAFLISPAGDTLLKIPNASKPTWMQPSDQVLLAGGVETIVPQGDYLLVQQFSRDGEDYTSHRTLYRYRDDIGLQKVEMDDVRAIPSELPYSDGSGEHYYGHRLMVEMSAERGVYWPFETQEGVPVFPPEGFRGFGPAFALGSDLARLSQYAEDALWYSEWQTPDGPRFAIFESDSLHPTIEELLATEQIATLKTLKKVGADVSEGYKLRPKTGQLITQAADGTWTVMRNANPLVREEVEAMNGAAFITSATGLRSEAEALSIARNFAQSREDRRIAAAREAELKRQRREALEAAKRRALEAHRAAARAVEARRASEERRQAYQAEKALAAMRAQARTNLIEGTFPGYRLRLYYEGPLQDADIREKAQALVDHMDWWALPSNSTTTHGLMDVPASFVESLLPYMPADKAEKIRRTLPYTRGIQQRRVRNAARQAQAERYWEDVHQAISSYNAGPVQGPVQTVDPIYERQSQAWAFGKANRPPCTASNPCGPGNEFREYD